MASWSTKAKDYFKVTNPVGWSYGLYDYALTGDVPFQDKKKSGGPTGPWWGDTDIGAGPNAASSIPQFFTDLKQNNPLDTPVGKYGLGYTKLLDPKGPFGDIAKLDYNELMDSKEMKSMQKFADVGYWRDLVGSAVLPAAAHQSEQARERAKAAGLRGGLGSAGQRTSEARSQYGISGGMMDAMAQANLTGAQMSQQTLQYLQQQRTMLTDMQFKKLLAQLGIEESVLTNIINPVQGYKAEANILKKQMEGQAAGALGEGVGSLAGLAGLLALACWVAVELWGENDPLTQYARVYATFRDNWFTRAYRKHGRKWASMLKAHPWLKPLARPIWTWMAHQGLHMAFNEGNNVKASL